MKAIAAFPAEQRVRPIRHPAPPPPRGSQLRVRTLQVGVCGTDGELCAFHFGHPPARESYLVLGHEALGVVEEVGPEVRSLTVGELVVPSVRRPCPRGDCPACRTLNQDYCVTGEYTERGIYGAHGFLVEHFTEDERFLFRVPTALRSAGVLAEPLTIAEKGLRQYLAIQRRLPWMREAASADLLRGRRAVVLGAGPVGLLGAMLLRLRGCRVTVYSREPADEARAELVRSIGADYLSAGEVSVPDLAEAVGGIELVYEAAGAPGLSLAVVEVMDRNGVFILTGATGGGGRRELGADALLNHMVNHNLVIAGTVNASHIDFRSAITDLAAFQDRWPAALEGIITERVPMDEFADRALNRRGIKQIVDLTLTP